MLFLGEIRLFYFTAIALDFKEALKYFKPAAENGLVIAQKNIAMIYHHLSLNQSLDIQKLVNFSFLTDSL